MLKSKWNGKEYQQLRVGIY